MSEYYQNQPVLILTLTLAYLIAFSIIYRVVTPRDPMASIFSYAQHFAMYGCLVSLTLAFLGFLGGAFLFDTMLVLLISALPIPIMFLCGCVCALIFHYDHFSDESENDDDEIDESLRRLQSFYERGIITEEEHTKRRHDIIRLL